jgi:hypothetical protein
MCARYEDAKARDNGDVYPPYKCGKAIFRIEGDYICQREAGHDGVCYGRKLVAL